jgi:RHS repeat-associated protein
MFPAENFWGAIVPDWVKARNVVWLNYSEGQFGFGYTGPGDGVATTPSALVQMGFDHIATTNALWVHGENFLANNWSSGQNIMGQNNVYANYAIAKGLRTAYPQPVHNLALTGKDWFNDPVNGLARVTIDHQSPALSPLGSWTSAVWADGPLASAWSILILSSSLFQQGPVAVINVSPNPSAIGYPVVFDARSSYHKHPGYKIIEYRWVFDSSKGVDFNHPDAVGPLVTNVFGALSTNLVSLEVADNGTPQLFDTASVVVQTTIPPYPPTADAGGPYVACAGQDVHLDGSGSFCVDASTGNFIQSYDWEVNYQVPLTFNQGVSGPTPILTNGYPTAGAYQIGLQVKNANSLVYTNFALPDETSDAFTTVYVYNRVITDLHVRPKATKAQLTWTKVGDYAVIVRSQAGPDHGFTQVGQTDSSYATFLDTTIDYSTEYFYRVYAYQNGNPAALGVSDPIFVVSPPRDLDEHAPKFQSTPSRVAKVGQLYEVVLDAVSPENEPLYFSLLSGQTNLTVNPTNGLVDFTPTAAQIGNQFLSFQVSNIIGRDVLSFTVFVFPATNHPPVVNVNGPYAALIGQPIQFSSAGTMDPDNNPLRLYWNFGDGSTSTNANPVRTYGGVGDYLVSLFANDGYGGTTTAQTHAQITRPNVPPIAVVNNGPNFTVRLGETLTLDGSGSYSPIGNPITYTWVWGDGSTTTNAPNIATHLYGAGGPYAGGLTVADNRGGRNTYNFQVTMAPATKPPVIALTVSNNPAFAMAIVTFDATGTVDPQGDPMTFWWDFGDHYKTTGPLVTHFFQQITNYDVVLTVSNSHNAFSVATQIVQVVDAPPVFTTTPPLMIPAGKLYSYVPIVTDLAGAAVTFQLVTGPKTMSCDTNTGALNWLPGTNNIGPNAIDLLATDANGGATHQSFTLVVTTPLGPQIDLAPTHIEMSNVVVDAQSLALSGTVTVYFQNNGTDPVPVPYTVSVFVDNDQDGTFTTNDTVVGYGNAPANFPAGGQASIEMTVFGQTLFKDCPLYAFVDSQDVVVEYNKANNIARSGFDANTNIPPVIDLSASYLQVDRSSLPAKAVLTARLGNSGLVAVPTNVPIAFYDGDPKAGGALIGVANSTEALDPGMYQDLSVTWQSPTVTNHNIFVVGDDPGNGVYVYTEITYSNNLFSVAENLAAILPPIADAGQSGSVYLGDTVQLNGSASQDPQSRPLTYAWSFFSIPFGSRAQLTGTNTVSPSFKTDLAGQYAVQLVVNNGLLNSTNSALASIIALDTNVYSPPKITSIPSFQAIVGVPYTYQVVAKDPQNGPLTYRLPQGPTGMTISTNAGFVQWTPTNSGSFLVQVAADGRGGSFYQGYTLTVIPFTNLPPQFTSTPIFTVAPTSNYAYTAVAPSPVGNTVSYALTQSPPGMAINGVSGLVAWTPTVNQLGGFPVTITANDGHGGTATQSYTLVVFNGGSGGPQVATIPDQTVTAPATFATVSLDNYVADVNYPANQITWKVSGTNLLSVVIDSNRVAIITYPAGVNAAEQITFLATDPAGLSGYSSPLLTVLGNATPPIAALANLDPNNTTSITNGTFNLLGTADDPGVPVPVAYRIHLYGTSGALVADVTPAPIDAGGWHEGRVPAGGSLGKLDFTLVRNGAYTLMLEVQAAGQIVNATAQISLTSELKLGQERLGQLDLSLQVQGVPLQVIRNYDSFNNTSTDFGYGWTYAVADLGVTLDETRTDTQDAVDGTSFSLRTGGSWDVTLTMPDTGRTVTFNFSLFQGSFTAQAVWNPPAGVNATLVPTISPILVTLPGVPPIWQAAGDGTDWQAFDWPGFILTLQNGTRYQIDRQDLGQHFYATDSGNGGFVHAYSTPFLSRLQLLSGEQIKFVREGTALQSIQRYDAATNQLKALFFQRDPQNRIVAVYTQDNLATNGGVSGLPSVTYVYDASGNLSKASKLIDPNAPGGPSYATTTYLYENPTFPHYITGMMDPRGVPVMRMEYDSQGRLTAIVDASGQRTQVQHNLAAMTDTIFDRLGNPTVYGYDQQGNIVLEVDPLGGSKTMTYDANHNITMEVDPLGNTNLYTRDAAGNVLTYIDPLGNVTTKTYDSNSHLLSSTDPLGRATQFTYDAGGNLLSTTDSRGATTTYQYDSANNQIASADALGNVTRFIYDTSGNLLQQIDPLGHTTTYTYDSSGNVLSQSDVVTVTPGVIQTNVILMTYDQANRLTSVTDPSGAKTLTEYDLAGNTAATVDPLGHRTAFTYDASARLVYTIYADGTSNHLSYDANGRCISSTDRQQRTTYYQYDSVGQLTSTLYPDFSQIHAAYDLAGRSVAQTDERGNQTLLAYDAAGHQTAVTNALGYVELRQYDAAGRISAVIDALGRTTTCLYDNVGRLTRKVYPDASSTQTMYDLLGRKIANVDQLGVTTTFGYDGLGRLSGVTNASGTAVQAATSFQFNEIGDLTALVDPNGHVTTYKHDSINRVCAVTLALGQRSTTNYDAAGNPISITNFNAEGILFEYDVNNRLVAKHLPDTKLVTYSYTAEGLRETIGDARGTTRYQYDARDRLVRRTDPDARFVAYSYDTAGNRTVLSTPTRTNLFTFDVLNRLQSVTDAAGGVTRYNYDVVNNLISAQLPNGTVRTNLYDELNRLTGVVHANRAGVFANFNYSRDLAGNRRTASETFALAGQTTSVNRLYDYDAQYRLIGESVLGNNQSNSTNTYIYDVAGNRLMVSNSEAITASYAYDSDERLIRATEASSHLLTQYAYDGEGRTISRSNATESVSYVWTPEDRLAGGSVVDTNGILHQLAYVYDDDGIRVGRSEVTPGTTNTVTYLIDDNLPFAEVLEESQANNAQPAPVTVAYTYGLQLLSQTRLGFPSYYHQDSLGSTRTLTGASGTATDRYDYDAFGQTVSRNGTSTNEYLFAGEQEDSALELYYLRSRYLDPAAGRFINRDTFPGDVQDPLSLHRYLYAKANPVNLVDPSGEQGTITEEITATAEALGVETAEDGVGITVRNTALAKVWQIYQGGASSGVLTRWTHMYVFLKNPGPNTGYRYEVSTAQGRNVFNTWAPLVVNRSYLQPGDTPKVALNSIQVIQWHAAVVVGWELVSFSEKNLIASVKYSLPANVFFWTPWSVNAAAGQILGGNKASQALPDLINCIIFAKVAIAMAKLISKQ